MDYRHLEEKGISKGPGLALILSNDLFSMVKQFKLEVSGYYLAFTTS